jgi:hypothetical protein
MITKTRFDEIHNEVKTTIGNAYDELAKKFPEHYIMLLADCEYEKRYQNQSLSPYTLDNATDRFKDESRINFLVNFLKNYYSFQSGQTEVIDENFRIQTELMVYTHIWESKAHLRMLYRMAHLLNGESYDWDVIVPDMSKHEFIRFGTKDVFNQALPSMGDVIKNGYHSSLRNAFAHSEYSLDTMNKHNRINLYNYKGSPWELKTITFDEWTERFVYSALLSYFMLDHKHNRRKGIVTDFGTNTFQIPFPPKNDPIAITYNPSSDGFNYVRV